MPHFDNINSNISKLHADLTAAGLAVVGICHEAPDFVRVDWPEGIIPSKTLIDQQNAIGRLFQYGAFVRSRFPAFVFSH